MLKGLQEGTWTSVSLIYMESYLTCSVDAVEYTCEFLCPLLISTSEAQYLMSRWDSKEKHTTLSFKESVSKHPHLPSIRQNNFTGLVCSMHLFVVWKLFMFTIKSKGKVIRKPDWRSFSSESWTPRWDFQICKNVSGFLRIKIINLAFSFTHCQWN